MTAGAPALRPALSPAQESVIFVLAAVLAAAFRAATRMTLEDALITFRFAENLARGHGFAFNPGEPVLGTTTPLLTLVLAGLGAVFGPTHIPVLAHVFLIACAAATAVVGARIVARAGFGTGAALLAGVLAAVHPDLLWTAAGGMETPLVLLLMAASLEALLARRFVRAAALASLLVLARPDGAIWALLVAAAIARVAPRRLPAALGVALLVQAPWLLWATATFGSPLPHSIVAKATLPGVQTTLLDAFRPTSLRTYLPWFAEWSPLPPGGRFGLSACVLSLAASVFGAWRVLRAEAGRAGTWILAAFPPALALAYLAGRAPTAFPWYGVPATWALVVLAAIGIAGAWRATIVRGFGGRAAAGAVTAVLAVGLAAETARTVAYERAFQENEDATRRRVGEWLDASLPAGASVAMEAIGYQGTFAQRRVVDLAGLVSPEVVAIRRGSASNAEAYERVFRGLRPDAIVLRSFEVDEDRSRDGGAFFTGAAGRAWFEENYREAARFTAPHPEVWGGGARLTVYRKVGT